jgi:hypothetical protein
MSVLKKLQKARFELTQIQLKKSGKNKFAGYEYFELGDFIPSVHKLFNEIGLCGAFSITDEKAELRIHDVDEEKFITFSTPTVMADNPKGQAIQNLGSTHTYLRRYLWVMALELVESDEVDSSPNKESPKVVHPAPSGNVREHRTLNEPIKPWEIKVDVEEGSDAWLNSVFEAAEATLGFAETVDDVMAIFKRNKVTFDAIKKADLDFHKMLMEKFGQVKKALEEK